MEENTMFENMDQAQSASPAELAQKIFSELPKDPGSLCILPYSQSFDNDLASFNFEILLTVYLEGLMNIMDVIKKNNQENANQNEELLERRIYSNINIDDLMFPDPWFKSFGYTINVTEYSKDMYRQFNNKIKPFSYCRILLSFDLKDKLHFLMKGITTKYTFVLCANYKPCDKIEQIYAVLNNGDKNYQISFKEFKV